MDVALRKESVDRNQQYQAAHRWANVVALRKESVDRNQKSVSVTVPKHPVALRKESVDRNYTVQVKDGGTPGRSPQGERG